MMRNTVRAVVTLMFWSIALSNANWSEDKVAGAIWDITFIGRDRKANISKQFRAAPDQKVYNRSGEQLGTWEGTDAKATMKINSTVETKFHGTYELVREGKTPPTWKGRFTDTNGRDHKIAVKLVKD